MKESIMKLIFMGIAFFISAPGFSQSASAFASTLGHSAVSTDSAQRVTVTSVVKLPQPPAITNNVITGSTDNTVRVNHITLQKATILDPNRPPMMAIPANQTTTEPK